MTKLISKTVICLVLIFISSCGQPAEKTEVVSAAKDSNKTNEALAPSPFNTLDAESLIGKYYNQQNQHAKYALYKSVATQSILIDSSFHQDTILLTVSTNGRKWPNPNRDTITAPFMETLVLKVFRNKQIWWADKLQSPDAVNFIQEPVKK